MDNITQAKIDTLEPSVTQAPNTVYKAPDTEMKPISNAGSKPSPNEVIAKPPATPNSKHPRGSKVVKSITGVRFGAGPAHNVSILDMTFDGTQVFPLLLHCDTCAWESRQLVMANAVQAASTHAGV